MQDADPSVGELVKGGVVVFVPGSESVVVGAGAGRLAQGAERPPDTSVGEALVAGRSPQDTLRFPDWRVIGAVPA
jgi:hypothetical protein